MDRVPELVWAAYTEQLAQTAVPPPTRRFYHKWLRYYLDFCGKYGHAARARDSLPHFLCKLAEKRQSPAQQRQALEAITLYYDIFAPGSAGYRQATMPMTAEDPSANGPGARASARCVRAAPTRPSGSSDRDDNRAAAPRRDERQATAAGPGIGSGSLPRARGGAGRLAAAPVAGRDASAPARRAADPVATRPLATSRDDAVPAVPVTALRPTPGLEGVSWQAELQALADEVRVRQYSPKTLKAYYGWTRAFQTFTRSKAPVELGTEDVKSFLTHLAADKGVSASSQNQAFNALLFFYRHALKREFGTLDGVVRAKRLVYVPVVLSRAEVDAVIAELPAPVDLVVKLMYGCGLRISECLELRVHCLNLAAGVLTVHRGKGQKDRAVPLPRVLDAELEGQLAALRVLHQQDLAQSYAGVFLPKQQEKKSSTAPRQFVWQWLFPALRLTKVAATNEYRRYHLHASHVQRAIRDAAEAAGVTKRVTAHSFRHSFASHLLEANYDIRTIQALLGHSDVKTTMIYTQTVPSRTLKEARSPLDFGKDEG